MVGSEEPKKVVVIILAAGLARRFKGIKQLARLKSGITLVQNALNIANSSEAAETLLVLGSNHVEIERQIDPGRSRVVENINFEKGLSTSVKTGIDYLSSDSQAAIFMVADQPFLTRELIDKMIDVYNESNKAIIALSHKGEPRNPVLLDKTIFPEAMKLEGDVGAREIVRRHIKSALLIDVDQSSVFMDIDTFNDLEKSLK